MIPLRLELKNFMSYGEHVPALDLSGVRLACLSGDNGNGKSAILDAITWALFDKTRASAVDDVVRLGATDCKVVLDFLIGNDKYRIQKSRGKRGGAISELQIWQEDGSLRSLSGTSANETKTKIEQLLRMDYQTFLATGYMAQGTADSFAKVSPTKRKEVLADILDLSRYERLEQLAKDRRKDAEDREVDAERSLNTINAQLEQEPAQRSALAAAQARHDEATDQAERRRTQQQQLTAEVLSLQDRAARAQDLTARITETEEEGRDGPPAGSGRSAADRSVRNRSGPACGNRTKRARIPRDD